MKVMIDPGHMPGSPNKGPTGYYEHEGAWKISKYLQEALKRSGIQADLTRTYNENPSLIDRGKKSAGYNLFISEHSNASNGSARGVEAYYSVKRPEDKVYAAKLSKSLSDLMGNPDRGAKTRVSTDGSNSDYYTVINAAASVGTPHIFLVENGFHDNVHDEAFLKSDANLKKIAETQAKIICEILGVPYKAEVTTTEHWAQSAYNYLNSRGIKIYETRFDDPVTRGELFVILDQIMRKIP